MKVSALAIAGFGLVAAGCGNNTQSLALETNELGLNGVVVRDHPMGAEVVTSPNPEHPPGTILVQINEIPIRGAAHARDLLAAARTRGMGFSLASMPPPRPAGAADQPAGAPAEPAGAPAQPAGGP